MWLIQRIDHRVRDGYESKKDDLLRRLNNAGDIVTITIRIRLKTLIFIFSNEQSRTTWNNFKGRELYSHLFFKSMMCMRIIWIKSVWGIGRYRWWRWWLQPLRSLQPCLQVCWYSNEPQKYLRYFWWSPKPFPWALCFRSPYPMIFLCIDPPKTQQRSQLSSAEHQIRFAGDKPTCYEDTKLQLNPC